MKIKHENEIIDVFGIYWSKEETYFYGLPPKCGHLLAYTLDEVTIECGSFNMNARFKISNGGYFNGIFHWALLEDWTFVEQLCEGDSGAHEKFVKILKEEGLIDEDFY